MLRDVVVQSFEVVPTISKRPAKSVDRVNVIRAITVGDSRPKHTVHLVECVYRSEPDLCNGP